MNSNGQGAVLQASRHAVVIKSVSQHFALFMVHSLKTENGENH